MMMHTGEQLLPAQVQRLPMLESLTSEHLMHWTSWRTNPIVLRWTVSTWNLASHRNQHSLQNLVHPDCYVEYGCFKRLPSGVRSLWCRMGPCILLMRKSRLMSRLSRRPRRESLCTGRCRDSGCTACKSPSCEKNSLVLDLTQRLKYNTFRCVINQN